MQFLRVGDILACRGKTVVIDTETTGLHYWKDGLIGVGIHSPAAGVSGYMPTCTYESLPYGKPKTKQMWLGKKDYSKSKRGRRVLESVETQPERNTAVPAPHLAAQARQAVFEMANDPTTTLIGQNLKFDLHFLSLKSWELPCKILDTAVMVHLYDSRLPKNLESAEQYFLAGNSKREHVELAQGDSHNKPWHWQLDRLAAYCTNDCVVTYQLAEMLAAELRKLKLGKLLNFQMKYLRLLQKMEYRGILLDFDFIEVAKEVLGANLASLEESLFANCGKRFNWRSNDQLSKVIYDEMGIPKPENPFADAEGNVNNHTAHSEKYNESCTSSFLLVEKAKHPLGNLIVEMRECAKLRGYLTEYQQLADENRVIHGSFNLTGTRTGRLSASKPNLQNIPSDHRTRENEGIYSSGAQRQGEYNLRQAIIARTGFSLVSIDHSQQEMRLLAILAQEENMLDSLRNREDIHLRNALTIWGDCGPELNKLHRQWSKAIGFGVVYGMGISSLQYRLNTTAEEAQRIYQEYWSKFPRVQPWINSTIYSANRQGYTRYWSGRLWREDDPSKGYMAANAQIQGGAADLIAIALVRADAILTVQKWGQIVSIIHDEVLFEIEDIYLPIAVPVLARVMEVEDIFGLPFSAGAKVGKSYGTLAEPDFEVNPAAVNWQDYNTIKRDYLWLPKPSMTDEQQKMVERAVAEALR